jgi:hypothetical protein
MAGFGPALMLEMSVSVLWFFFLGWLIFTLAILYTRPKFFDPLANFAGDLGQATWAKDQNDDDQNDD